VDLASLNLDDQLIVIVGEGDRPGAIPFGRDTEVRQMVDRRAHRRVSLGDRI
jgi:hypothetical protein